VELRQLRYAVAVADHLNFREASRALHVAQPSLSVQIKQLEEEIWRSSLHSLKAPCGDHPSG
jgi:DNA-binding transcriptional LysR family regulator